MQNRQIPHAFRRLRHALVAGDAPVLALIAVSSGDPYRVLTACILSLRTLDSTTADAAPRLFALAPDVRTLADADVAAVRAAIYPVGFYKTKAVQLVRIAKEVVARFDGRVPDDIETLLEFKGVGRKTANLVVTAGFGKPGICVDTHVHRISNRWGYVATRTPDETETELRAKLPRRYWREINELLVAHGQTICRPLRPRCDACSIARWCDRVGV